MADPFAVRPVQRSLVLCLICGSIVLLPWQVSAELGATVMVTIGWLAITGLMFGIPVLLISLVESAVETVRGRLHAPVEQLGLSPRVLHVLRRHGIETIDDVRRIPDWALLSLSNMDNRGLQEIRKQLALRDYRHWQDAGYPAKQR